MNIINLPTTAADRARVIDVSLRAFGCTREQLARQYLRNADQSDRSAKVAAIRGGTYRGYTVDQYKAHAEYARTMAAECAP